MVEKLKTCMKISVAILKLPVHSYFCQGVVFHCKRNKDEQEINFLLFMRINVLGTVIIYCWYCLLWINF